MDSGPMIHRVVDDASGRFIEASVVPVGPDVVIVVGGGTHPHVGAMVVCQPDPRDTGDRRGAPSTSVVTIPPHKEEAIARPIAEAVCRATGRPTVVTAGVHEDQLSPEGITTYLELARRLADVLVSALSRESESTKP